MILISKGVNPQINPDFFSGIKIFVSLLVLLRIAGLVCGAFYGPYIYLVICVTGIYLAGKILYMEILMKITNFS